MTIENPFSLLTPEETGRDVAEKMKQLRLARDWKQETLATRAGVALASLRRFERTGQISLKSLLRLAFALGRLEDFVSVFQQPEATSIRELEKASASPRPKRGSR